MWSFQVGQHRLSFPIWGWIDLLETVDQNQRQTNIEKYMMGVTKICVSKSLMQVLHRCWLEETRRKQVTSPLRMWANATFMWRVRSTLHTRFSKFMIQWGSNLLPASLWMLQQHYWQQAENPYILSYNKQHGRKFFVILQKKKGAKVMVPVTLSVCWQWNKVFDLCPFFEYFNTSFLDTLFAVIS